MAPGPAFVIFSVRQASPTDITVRVVACSNLPDMDGGGNKSDPYVKVIVMGNKQKTKVSKHGKNPSYEESNSTFQFSVNPQGTDIFFEVWDKDTLSRDDLMGKAQVRIGPGLAAAGASGAFLALPLTGQGISDDGFVANLPQGGAAYPGQGFPQQPGYPQAGYQPQPGYPAQPGFPGQQPGAYPAQPGAYPPPGGQPGYPAPGAGYPGYPPQESSWYFIETSNGLVLTLNSDDDIVLSERDDEAEDNKLWRLDEDGILHSKTGLVVDIPGSNEDAGVGLIGYHDIHGGDNQRFTFDGSSIRSELNGFVFDVEEGVMEEGSAVIMWPHHGGENQSFNFVS